MDKREALKSVLNNLINDRHEEASLDLHNYFTSKMREVSGIATATVTLPTDEAGDITDTDAGAD